MKILMVGAGGIGGYFGARLHRAGADIHFLLRGQRLHQLSTEGLHIESPDGNFHIQPRVVSREALTPDYDLIVLSPKAYDLESVLADLAPALGQALVLPFLNGFTHMQRLDAWLGADNVLGGVAHIGATITPTGAVRRLNELHRLTVGVRHAKQQAVAQAFVDAGQRSGFESVLSSDIEQALWNKWVFLASLAAITTLCHGTVGEVMATAHGESLTRRLYGQACDIASAQGRPIPEGAQVQALAMLCQAGSTFTASMLRDLEQGQRTEHEHILGELIALGDDGGVGCDLLRIAHTQLQVAQAQRLAR